MVCTLFMCLRASVGNAFIGGATIMDPIPHITNILMTGIVAITIIRSKLGISMNCPFKCNNWAYFVSCDVLTKHFCMPNAFESISKTMYRTLL